MCNWFIVLNKDVSKQKSSLKRPPVCDWVNILYISIFLEMKGNPQI